MITCIENKKSNELFNGPFELILSGYSTGDYNMKFDFERTEACANGDSLPMFRLYGWNPWCVSLGFNQKETDVNSDACSVKGFDIVRRPTGGRAVLHANELTYSVVMNLPEGKTVHDVYRDIHVILLNSFKCLADGNSSLEDLDFEKSQPDFREFYKQSGVSVACFASSARYEIALKGKKIVGSAQRLFGNTLLQHGSILLADGHEQLADVAVVQSEQAKDVLKKYIINHSATLEEALMKKVSFEEAQNVVANYLQT